MKDKKINLLYVEDDQTLSFIIRDNLERAGYSITLFENGKDALDSFRKNIFDLCILDIMLPKLDGFSLAKEIRKLNKEVPIIFLTAKSLHEDKITGLKLGADDYIIKPFSMEELLLKIEIFIKRSKLHITESTNYSVGKYRFDYENFRLRISGKDITLTYKEAEILKFLLTQKNELVSRDEILNEVWGESDYFLGRSLDVFISKLRKHLKEDPNIKIENRHGIGFILKVKD